MKILILADFHGGLTKNLIDASKKVDLVLSLGDFFAIDGWFEYLPKMFKSMSKGGYLSPEKYWGKKDYERRRSKGYDAMKKVLRELNHTGQVYTVMGNYDYSLYNFPFQKNMADDEKDYTKFFKSLKHIKSINYKVDKIKGVQLLGFGGYMDNEFYFKTKSFRMRPEKDRKMVLERFAKMKNLFTGLFKKLNGRAIFVFHYPPAGVFDEILERSNPWKGQHVGIGFFRDAIKKNKPYFVLCGHMHEHRGMKKLYGVPVINPGEAGKGEGAIIDFDFEKKKFNGVKFIPQINKRKNK